MIALVIDGKHIYIQHKQAKKKKNINQNALHYLLSIGLNNIEIGKIFEVFHYTVIRWVKEYNLNDLLIEPEDNSVIENYLQEVIVSHKNLAELHAYSILLSKGIKIKCQRLRTILKRLKLS